jgi:predicted amidophosphoribosyltransferase
MTRQPLLFDDGSDLPLFSGTAYGGQPEPVTWNQQPRARDEYRQPTIGLCVRCFAQVEDTEIMCASCRHECDIEADYEKHEGNWW